MRGCRPWQKAGEGAQERKGLGGVGGRSLRLGAPLLSSSRLQGRPGPAPPISFPPFQVSLVDRKLLKFVKLEELVLSANQIKEIDTTNLPPTLKVKRQVPFWVLEPELPRNPAPSLPTPQEV